MDNHKLSTENNLLEVTNLSDYIKILQDYPNTDFIFRGENGKYDKRQASAFRGRKNKSFMALINDYYSTIGHRISDIEKENFLAFAQHYGLPTNLLDITSNPLSALFFACHEAKEKGCVYIFPESFLIDITEIIEAFPRESVFDLFLSGNPFAINKIHDLISNLFEETRGLFKITSEGTAILPGREHINHAFVKLFCMARDIYCEKNDTSILNITYEEMMTNVHGDGIVRSRDMAFHGFYRTVYAERERFEELLNAICKDEVMKDIEIPQKLMSDLTYYIIFILYCFRVQYKYKGKSDLTNYHDLFPAMIYRPKITFERARLQQGYFIYTPYKASSGIYTDIEIYMGNILPIQILEINNPVKILRELDNIGVNISTIYGDYDSIAKYIKDKESLKYFQEEENTNNR
jgi:hypothetical protein